MKVRFPLILCLLMGIIGMVAYYIPHRIVQNFDNELRNTALRIIFAFSLVLGVGSIIRHHWEKIKRKREFWEYSYVTLISLFLTAFIGLFGGIDGKGLIKMQIGKFSFDIHTIYVNMAIPLGATMFSLLAYFMASAAYRAFRARNFEAILLLIAAFIVMLASVPPVARLIPKLPYISEWILDVPNTAAKRGMLFGITLGVLSTSLKILLGIERGWLGGK
ncbi:MAG: hypothetical protein N2323_03320 [candidate division WOR-3 bacterium]|nr:hypothetical protein [candidate division WOR-3 bacterium]MCX7836972.1 hypothetical protein [candidate division WOR-3 bacterium]MDW8114100.1 hypothetical protein [candidate division WOR-3 bacterium]